MSLSSPKSNTQNNDKQYRQLPTLRELLSPSTPQANGTSAVPARFPSLTTTFPSPVSSSLHTLSPYTRPPAPPSWQAPSLQAGPGAPQSATDQHHRALQSAARAVDEQYDQRQRSALPIHTPLVSQPPRPSLVPGVEYRIPLGSVSQGLNEDRRRDSARSNSTYATSNSECVGQQHFPGRGLCYVYSDGATCPTVIDGELVNPLWGTTKAGKARKRLAQACLNCREKKIRCEPKHPRCVQCEKAKRECVMPAAQQGLQESSMLPVDSAHLPTLTPAPLRHTPTDTVPGQVYPSAKRRRSDEYEHAVPQGNQRDYSVPSKTATETQLERGRDAWPGPRTNGTRTSNNHETEGNGNGILPSVRNLTSSMDWDTDAWEVSKEDTSRLLDAFFAQNISVSSTMFPRVIFQRWVKTSQRKSSAERMVLYSMLALGAGASRDGSRFAKLCADRATAAVASNFGKFNFLLGQARIFLSLYANAIGEPHLASEYYSAAVHTLRICKLNTEDGCEAALRTLGGSVFDMSADQLLECMRRTFWAGALLDTVSAVCNNFTSILPSELIYLRMPARDSDYEQALPSRATFFEGSSATTFSSYRPDLATCSPLGFAIVISRIAADVGLFVHSAPHHPTLTFANEYDKFLRTIEDRQAKWLDSLPPVLNINGYNLSVAVEKKATIMITSLAAFYHMSVIHSVRFVRHRLLDRRLVARNIQRANESARQVLKLSGSLCAIGQNLPEGQTLQDLLSPTFAYVVFLAVETLCAGGHHSDTRAVLTAVMHGCTTFDSISYTWAFARPRQLDIERRLSKMQLLLHDPEKLAQDGEIMIDQNGWRFREPMEKHFELDSDAIYGIDGKEYLAAL